MEEAKFKDPRVAFESRVVIFYLLLFSSVGKKHLDSAYICKEPIYTFIWHLGTAQHTSASVIIWFKYLLFLFSWRLFVLLKYNLGASRERGF